MPVTLSDVERAVRAAWSSETAFATDAFLAAAPERPSRGQCGTTALVVQDLLGGDVLVADVVMDGVVEGVHYWNRLSGGLDVDLTRDQFIDGERVLPPRVVHRLPLPRPERARAAYLLLRRRVLDALAARAGDAADVAPSPT